jgi:hypothetical protein
MKEKEYLLYQASMLNSSYIDHRFLDIEKIIFEQNLETFLKYQGTLKKIVYLDERSISSNLLINSKKFKKLDALFLADFIDGVPASHAIELKKWIDQNQIPFKKITIMTHSNHECNLLKKIFNNDNEINFVVISGPLNIALREFLGKPYTKRFLFLSRNWNVERLVTFVDFHRRCILDNCYFSFFNIKDVYTNPNSSHEYYSLEEIDIFFTSALTDIDSINAAWLNELREYWNDNKIKIVEGMPYLLEDETNEVKGRPGQQFISCTLQNAFTNSAMSLLIETTNGSKDHDHFQCTEKTYKSMIYRHPFLVYGGKYQLKRTREYGFNTFSHIFDESYDNLNTTWERIYHINNQVETLNKMSNIDFKKLMFEAIPETTFNFNRVMEAFYNFKTNIDYEKFDKNFDNLLLNKPIDNWFNNLY